MKSRRCSWLVVAGCSALLACGGRSAHDRGVTTDAVAGSAGSAAAAGSLSGGGDGGDGGDGGGSLSSGGDGGGSLGLGGGTGGSLSSGGSTGGTAGGRFTGGAGSTGGGPAIALAGTAGWAEPDTVALCLYPDQMPDNWSAPAGDPTCAVGPLGQFEFESCRYELLDATPYDVDPFQGGHAHCCYLSRLVECP